MNKSAKEMFEELGYKLIKQPKKYNHLIEYQKYVKQFDELSTITFNKSARVFSKELNLEGWCIFMPELQAINKQIEELQWNE